MRIPHAYQSQALSSLPAITQAQQENPEQNSVSLRVGKLGIRYTSQEEPQPGSSTTDIGQTTSRIPTTSFAQELSLALAQSTTPMTGTDTTGWTGSTGYSRRMGLEAYTFQAGTMASVSTYNINTMV